VRSQRADPQRAALRTAFGLSAGPVPGWPGRAGHAVGVGEASASGWARGAAARSRALVSAGCAAEEEYREAIELLGSTAYARALRAASVPVTAHPGLGLIHGCFDMLGITAAARDEIDRVLRSVRETLAVTPSS